MAAGIASLAVFGLLDEPSVLREGMTLARVGAAALSLAYAAALILRVPQPPSVSTVLIVSLRLLRTPHELAAFLIGVALLTAEAWTLNRAVGVHVPMWAARG